jgi:hypothetical protein
MQKTIGALNQFYASVLTKNAPGFPVFQAMRFTELVDQRNRVFNLILYGILFIIAHYYAFLVCRR